uniref:N-acetylmuramoyl-L-alanine amidase n=1 Tax=Paractinoplanes polyasparticus TaxID=2856853 RepID=UPI001C84DB6B|nr:N-acetylmuramoyl-L-alanine amidase [Actinoplanes polyasparticus]
MRRRLAIGIGTAAAVLAAGGGVAVLTGSGDAVARFVSGDEAHAEAEPPAAPVKAAAAAAKPSGIRIDQVDLGNLGRKFSLPQRPTENFSMISVSWNSPKDAPDGTVQVRTRNAGTGQWTGWKNLSVAEDAADLAGERAKARGRTAPLWTGPSDGVAARLVGAATKPLPAGLLLKLIDPNAPESGGRGGGEPVPTPTVPKAPPPASPVPGATTATKPPATTATPPAPKATTPTPPPTSVPPPVPNPGMPAYVSRAGWKANESLVKAPPTIAGEGVKLVWVHHTGTEFPKTCADAPDFVRAIMATDISEGFDDIGYNFLVDNCGTIYEGRAGGVGKAVVGAHVAGFNTATAGIALIGDYTTVRPSNAALTSIAELAAARIGAYGNDPTGTTTLVAGIDGMKWPKGTVVPFPRIAGHRDGAETECPGDLFYPLLGQIRGRAALPGLQIVSVSGGEPTTPPFYVREDGTVYYRVGGQAADVSRFEVLVDSKVVATGPGNNTAGSAKITVTPGPHNVAVRVVHVTGATDITPVTKVIGDVTKPTFPTPPWVALKTGTYSATSVPVAVNFKSADNNGRIARQFALSPNEVPMLGTSTVWNATVKPNVAVKYTVQASDMAYNEGVSTVTRTIVQMPETSAKRTGTWSTRSAATTYLGGKALAASAKNAKLAYVFNGRSAALTFTRTTATGQAAIYVDGVKVTTVDTRAAKTTHRQTIWVKALTAGAHTVSVVVVGTKGRPTVISDGLTYVK